MNERQYRDLFASLEIEARDIGNVLRYWELPRRVYFNDYGDVGIYFSARLSDEDLHPIAQWYRVGTHLIQPRDQDRLNVVPRPGMEAQAFGDLVLNWQAGWRR